MATTWIQNAEGATSASGGSIAGTFGSNNTAGRFLYVTVSWDPPAGETISSLADTLGNSYIFVASATIVSSGQVMSVYYVPACLGGANTVTATFSGNVTNRRIQVSEYSGLNPYGLDISAATLGSTANGTDGTAATALVTTHTDAVFASATKMADAAYTPGTGWTEDSETGAGSGVKTQHQHRDQSSPGSITATWTTTDGAVDFAAIVVGFKALSFPTTGILDDFNRPNESPLGNGTWSGPLYSGENQLSLSSHACDGSTGNSYWSASQFGPDCECWWTLSRAAGNGEEMLVYARIANPNNASLDAYRVDVNFQAAGGEIIRIQRVDNASTTNLGVGVTQEVVAGDSIGIACIGSSIQSWYKASAGSWTMLEQVTDATYGAAGYIGAEEVGGAFVPFGGGTVQEEALTFPHFSTSYIGAIGP